MLGETTNEEWISTISKYPAPLAELEAPGNILFVLRSSNVRDKTDVHELMTWWNQHMINLNNLSGFPNGKRPRTEVMVFDPSTSRGKSKT